MILRTLIYSPGGALPGQSTAEAMLAANATVALDQEIAVANPALWSPESPKLYRAVTRVVRDGKAIDEVATPFGIRTLAWPVENGFLLNGKVVKLAGGCVHHDNGPLGSAAFDRAEERRVEKDAGFNAIRCAHNGRAAKIRSTQRCVQNWWQRDLASMVRRDRNHPSVVMWSIGNEIPERGEPLGAEEARMPADYVRGWTVRGRLSPRSTLCGHGRIRRDSTPRSISAGITTIWRIIPPIISACPRA